jgi:hypothetical protein
MFGFRNKLILAIVGWVATRALRKLSLPGLAIAVALEIVLGLVQSRLQGRGKA